MTSSLFFSLDGGDGAGKTTQIERFTRWLRQQGREVVACRDPGATRLGEALRAIVLGHDTPVHVRSEMLLYMAARAQLVEEVIKPALASGRTVVSDRYLLANVVYQGCAGGLPVETLWQVGEVAVDGVHPNLTFVLDLPVDAAANRRRDPPDRLEARGEAYHERVRQGFLAQARLRPDSMVVIDADRPADRVEEDIRRHAARFIEHGAVEARP